MNDSV